MRRLLSIFIVCLIAIVGASASAQSLATVDFGQNVSGLVSTEGGEFYAFAGLKDTKVQVQLDLPETLGAVTLYDRNGDEVARAEGVGRISLLHTLSADGVYLLGVTSATRGTQFSLTLDGQEPDYGPATVDLASNASAYAADPAIWGVYARLAGRRTEVVADSYTLAWVWTKPGEELVEQWLDGTGRVAHTNTVTPTGKPSQLLQRGSYLGGKEWLGVVGADGRVTYVGRGLLKKPYVVDVSPDGVFRMLRTKVDAEGRPTWIGDPYPNATWRLAPVSDGGH
ncbi:hypothetical protein LVB87_11395 [Lysobacter sp. KIS68-7]|uniref:hypothetical protein n=1 Tax=Lysobacter sp. KIS68-7 TaxID=2904252 RepID=UPI001E36B56C|nr:hypothetical protein [Lysobacter sp. KIS68-7]UHQ18786.1 hypothetical protein LVB87_11395 [Lysobacter sp. KIS68-7]